MSRTATRIAMASVVMVMITPLVAEALVNDDFESYTPGDPANVANEERFLPNGAYPIGSITGGTATANVPSSNVLEHELTGGLMFTLVGAEAATGEVSMSLDFRVGSGQHNIWVRDGENSREGALIRFLNGNASLYFIQVLGSTGSNPPAFEALVDYGDWVRANITFNLSATPSLSSFTVGFDNLTDGTTITPHAGTGAAFTFNPLSQVDLIQIESSGAGQLELDNIVLVPEPTTLTLSLLAGMSLLYRRR